MKIDGYTISKCLDLAQELYLLFKKRAVENGEIIEEEFEHIKANHYPVFTCNKNKQCKSSHSVGIDIYVNNAIVHNGFEHMSGSSFEEAIIALFNNLELSIYTAKGVDSDNANAIAVTLDGSVMELDGKKYTLKLVEE